MKNLLLIQKNSPLKDYIELYLKAFHEIQLIHVESVTEAVAEMSGGRSYDCIFIGNNLVKDGETKDLTGKVKEHLTANGACKIVGTNKGLSVQEWARYVPELAPPEQIFEAVRFGLELPEEKCDQDFVAIPMGCFNYFTESPCDIYFKLGAHEEKGTYVKRFNEGDEVDPADISKYIEKNMREVFIPSGKVDDLSKIISVRISKRAHDANGRDKKFEIVADALDYASYVLNSFGISLVGQEVVQKLVSDLIASVTKLEGKKAQLFQDILSAKEAFYHKHVSLTALLAVSLLEELHWSTEEARASITYAAFFQNFFINGEEDILCITEAQLKEISSEERREKITGHAKLACDFMKDLKDAPYTAGQLVLEHHGSTMGRGFPDQKKNSTQLSSLFMIANEFSLHLLLNFESKSGEDMQELLKSALTTYGAGQVKILEALQNCITGQMAKAG